MFLLVLGIDVWLAELRFFESQGLGSDPLFSVFDGIAVFFFQPDSYACPQCAAPKKRFARYDVSSGKPIGGSLPPIGVIVGLVAGLAAVGALLVYGLQ